MIHEGEGEIPYIEVASWKFSLHRDEVQLAKIPYIEVGNGIPYPYKEVFGSQGGGTGNFIPNIEYFHVYMFLISRFYCTF